jgi:hypothetical protein
VQTFAKGWSEFENEIFVSQFTHTPRLTFILTSAQQNNFPHPPFKYFPSVVYISLLSDFLRKRLKKQSESDKKLDKV